jgi:photosystem II stability/assembly factor-like uncharacterized protein
VDAEGAEQLRRWLRSNPLLLLGVGLLLVASIIVFAYPVLARFSSKPRTTTGQWQAAGLQGVLVHSLALSHRHPGLIFAAAHDGIYRRDRNQDWVRVYQSGDVWSIVLLPDEVTVLAADNDGYVDITRDSGNHWRRSKVGSQGTYAVSAVPGHPHSILVGAGGGVYRSTDGGGHWQRRLSLPQSAPDAFAWMPGSDRTVFLGAVANAAGIGSGVFISRDAGLTWRPFGHAFNTGGGIMSVAVSPPNRVFGGTMGHAIWSASGPVWRRTAAGMPTSNDHVAAIVSLPGRSLTMFAGTLGSGVYRSIDAGRHWKGVSTGLAPSGNPNPVLSLAYDPRQHVLYAGTADGVYTAVIASSSASSK